MTPFATLRRVGASSASAAATAVVLTAALWVQHARSGWPFAPDSEAAAVLSASVIPSAAAPAPRHNRVPVDVNAATVQELGIRLEVVGRTSLTQEARAVATVVPDESRISHVHTRVAGWVEQLDVNTTGEMVRAGQTLARIFSQELLSSQTEYLAARRNAAASGITSTVVASGRTRLTVLGMTAADIDKIERTGESSRLVTVVAPRSGVVVNRGVTVGTSVDPSTTLLTIADLSRVWVLAEVPEANIPGIRVGTTAHLDFPASGRQPFPARVDFLYPTLTERTRTLRVRFSAANPGGSLRPGLYGTAVFESVGQPVIAVPRDAVVDTGIQQHVFVATGDRFEPRAVTLGVQLADRVEVRSGLEAGERIVAAGVFLLDSESRLRATGGAGGHNHGAPTTQQGTLSTPAIDPHAGHRK
ncbi:MAG TPA: efflux RND transporter periplasmic adaptor subunit [Vicinamibacterales bacterium]|nr:efflux RND transporter periplasmic adaptor subunit [Vicinamibacterales bacterium]